MESSVYVCSFLLFGRFSFESSSENRDFASRLIAQHTFFSPFFKDSNHIDASSEYWACIWEAQGGGAIVAKRQDTIISYDVWDT